MDPLKTLNRHINFERQRTVRGFLRPRISHNFLTDKTHRNADAVAKSDAQTLEKSVECGCPEGTHHTQENRLCQISGVFAFFDFKDVVWKRFYNKHHKKGVDDDIIYENWGKLGMLNRYEVSKASVDDQGNATERYPIGFHDGPMGEKRYRQELQ